MKSIIALTLALCFLPFDGAAARSGQGHCPAGIRAEPAGRQCGR